MLNVPTGFARLLASENIGVRVDDGAPTAYFDTANRILTMPNWDCSERLRDMLIGHECAHAIFTDDKGDILSVIRKVGSDDDIAKQFLNVIEDVRIDRLIQRRYPGLRIDYKAGLREMWQRDFFGLKGRDPNTLSLLDRINCHFKGSPTTILFTPEEQIFVNRAEKIETFEEAIDLARDLYDFESSNSKTTKRTPTNAGKGQDGQKGVPTNGNPMAQDDSQDGASAGPSDDSSDSNDDSSNSDGQGKGEGTAESAKDAEDDGSTADSTRSNSQGGEGENSSQERNDNSDAPGRGMSKTGTPKGSETLRNAENEIAKTAKKTRGWGNSTNYALPASLDISKIIITNDVIRNAIAYDHSTASAWSEFKSGAKVTVTNLAQMFERKKAAAVNQRSQVAKTGRLDMTNLHKYKMTEDIFLRNRVVIKGKNHGMIVFVDWSGSMQDCIAETIQQTVVLAMFCKKVGIPFRVYAFSSYIPDSWMDKSNGFGIDRKIADTFIKHNAKGLGNHKGGQERLMVNYFTLLELFTDKMSAKEFDYTASALIAMGNGGMHYGTPRCLQLGGTPLNESIIAAMQIAKKFREESRVDVMNSIWITDGGDMSPFYGTCGLVQDNNTGEVWSYDSNDPTKAQGTDLLFRIYKDKIGGNLIGIYLDNKKSVDRRLSYLGNTNYYGERNPDPKRFNAAKMREQFKNEQFVEYPHMGYDTYFLMDKKVAVYTGAESLEALPDNATNTRVINAFKRDLAKRAISRPLLNAFTDRIAREMV